MKGKIAFLNMAKLVGAFAVCRWLTRNSTRILCYHGGSLGDEYVFNGKLFCPPGLLDQRLGWLAANGFIPSTLADLADRANDHSHAGIPVVVTLDDGWYSSAKDLLPVLAQQGYRPVLYLHTAAFVSGAPLTSVASRYILWKSRLKNVTLNGFTDGIDGNYHLESASDKSRLLTNVQQWLTECADDAVATAAALERFSAALGVPPEVLDLPSRRFSYMRADELADAAAHGCSIELHGHRHRYEPGDPEGNRLDIEICREHIVALGLPNPSHYCYPSGTHDADAGKVLRAAGVSTGTTCLPGLVRRVDGGNRYFLPRFLDGGNVTMIEFEAEMSGVLEVVRNVARSIRLR